MVNPPLAIRLSLRTTDADMVREAKRRQYWNINNYFLQHLAGIFCLIIEYNNISNARSASVDQIDNDIEDNMRDKDNKIVNRLKQANETLVWIVLGKYHISKNDTMTLSNPFTYVYRESINSVLDKYKVNEVDRYDFQNLMAPVNAKIISILRKITY